MYVLSSLHSHSYRPGLLAVLADDDRHGRGRDHPELRDDHGDVLHGHGVVHQVHHVQAARVPVRVVQLA